MTHRLAPTLHYTEAGTLEIVPWLDPVVDAHGFDPRSAYVEQFWLGILGPSTTWLLRRLAAAFDERPDGYVLDLAQCAKDLGLGFDGGHHSPFSRSLGRLCSFDLARQSGISGLAVRCKVPPISRRQIEALTPQAQGAHRTWTERHTPTDVGLEQVRQLAWSFVAMGADLDTTEQQLLRWTDPLVARTAAVWAIEAMVMAESA